MVVSKEIIEEWVDLYSDDLYRWAVYKTNDKEQAKDLVQETFMACMKSIQSFKGNSSPKTWLISILNHKIIDFHRKRARYINSSNTEQDFLDKVFNNSGSWNKEFKNSMVWNEVDGELLDNYDFIGVFRKCIDDLPEKWSSTIQLKYIENKNGKEICNTLEISESNYWQIIHRAKLLLKTCLEKFWFTK